MTQGLSRTWLLLALALVAVLCLTAWLLFRPDRTRVVPAFVADPHFNDTKYLKVPEVGVKFELSDDIKDAYYYISPDSYVYFSVHQYDHVKGMEDCTARGKDGDGGGLAVLGSAKLGEEKAGKVWTRDELAAKNAKQVGATYYWLDAMPSCFDPDKISTETSTVRSTGQFQDSFLKQQSTITRL